MAKLFYDDEFDALALTISNSAKEVKECAAFLFPHLKPLSGYARLKACLNPEKDERLTFGQIIALCRFCENYDALYFMCDELMHARPQAVSPLDKQAELLRDFNRHVEQLGKIQQQLLAGGLPLAPGLKAVP